MLPYLIGFLGTRYYLKCRKYKKRTHPTSPTPRTEYKNSKRIQVSWRMDPLKRPRK